MEEIKIECGNYHYTFTNKGIEAGDYVIVISNMDGYTLGTTQDVIIASRMKSEGNYVTNDIKYRRVEKVLNNRVYLAREVWDMEYVYKIKNIAKYRLTMFTNNCYLDMNVDENVLSQLKVADIVRFLTPGLIIEYHDAGIYEDDGDLCILKDESWFHLTKNYEFYREGKRLNL